METFNIANWFGILTGVAFSFTCIRNIWQWFQTKIKYTLGAVAILHGQPDESAGQGDDAFKIALQFVVSRGDRSEML